MSRLVFDIEGDNLLYQVEKVWCITTEDAETGECNRYGPDQLEEGIAALRAAECLVGHNIVGYDLPAIWKVLGAWDTTPPVLDTLIISRFLHPERPNGHSLGAWADRLGMKKGDFDDFHYYSPEMMEYCALDTHINVAILKALEAEHGATFEGFKIYR